MNQALLQGTETAGCHDNCSIISYDPVVAKGLAVSATNLDASCHDNCKISSTNTAVAVGTANKTGVAIADSNVQASCHDHCAVTSTWRMPLS